MFIGCSRKPDPNIEIQKAVAATLSARPEPTRPPQPTPFPMPTPVDLAGLFCEYHFCIGHPPDMAFFDVSAQQNPGAPSTYTQGIIAAYSSNLFIQMMWQISPGTSDPTFLLDLILDDTFDIPSASPAPRNVGSATAIYTPIATTATPLLPFGAAAAWTCGDRVFAWKVYTPDTASPEALFNDAMRRFTCE
jgi:hypothetical protein